MMNPDDIDPLRSQPKRLDLQPLSVKELHDYIASLHDEITRAENMIRQKESHKNGIEALFGAPKR